MKRSMFVICCLVITMVVTAQNASRIEVFDLSGVEGDTSRAISLKGEDMGFVQLVFTSFSCDTSELKIGYTLSDTLVTYPSTISGLDQPVTLNKLAVDPSDPGEYLFTHTINNKTNSALGINIPSWRPYFMVFTLRKACNSGKLILIHRR